MQLPCLVPGDKVSELPQPASGCPWARGLQYVAQERHKRAFLAPFKGAGCLKQAEW